MSSLFPNLAFRIPALDPLLSAAQGSPAVFSSAVGELRRQLDESRDLSHDQRERIQGILTSLDREASRYEAVGSVPQDILAPALESLAGAWPVQLYSRGGGVLYDISSRFRIREGDRIGRGGCGNIFQNYDPELGEVVAIKVADVGDPTLAATNLRREFDTLRALSPGTGPRVYDFGMVQGKAYMVMELLQGRGLDEMGEEFRHGLKTRSDFDRLLDVGRGLVEAVAAIHDEGFVHLDVKPDNFKCHEDIIRILDFGISRREGEGRPSLLGTPHYLAPENFEKDEIISRFTQDVFALGGTLYWLLTGQTPFEGKSQEIWEIVKNIVDLNFSLKPPSEVLFRERPDLMDALSMESLSRLYVLDEIVMKALQRDAGLRYSDAREMRADLEASFGDADVVVVADRRRVRRASF